MVKSSSTTVAASDMTLEHAREFAALPAQQAPRSAADEELIELKMQLFERDFASRLGRDPMAAGLNLYRQILCGERIATKDFTDFVAMFPPLNPRSNPRPASPLMDPAAQASTPTPLPLSSLAQRCADRFEASAGALDLGDDLGDDVDDDLDLEDDDADGEVL